MAAKLYDSKIISKHREILAFSLREGKWEGTINRIRKNGLRFMACVVITPRRDSLVSEIGFLLTSKNISVEIRLTEELNATQFYTRSLIESGQQRSRKKHSLKEG